MPAPPKANQVPQWVLLGTCGAWVPSSGSRKESMEKGSNGEGERGEEACTEKEMELGKGCQCDRGDPYGKAGPPNPRVLFPPQDPVLALFWVSVLQLGLGSEGRRGTPLHLQR